MTRSVVSFYLQCWPFAAAALCLAALSMSTVIASPRRWTVISVVVIAAALAIYVPPLLAKAADPGNNILARDVAAFLLWATGAPAMGARVAFLFQANGALGRVLGLAMSLLWLAVTPFVVLFVHCTSGDCL
jgi:hypothetical protein